MGTRAQRQERGVFPSPPPPPPPPPASANGNGVGSGNGNSQWRKYLDGLVSLCNDTAGRCPTGSLVDPPPPGLLVHRPPCSIISEGNADPSAIAGQGGVGHSTGGDSGGPSNGRRVARGGASNDPVLVLLDMNGTLLYRAKKPLRVPQSGGGDGRDGRGGGGGGAGTVAFVHGDPVPLQYYMRPGAAELVAAMARHPRVRLAFYTSMRGVNALPAASFLMPEEFKSSGTAPEVYDRPFNARDTGGVNHWDTTRNLPLIWATPGRSGAGFGAANTVMVDDTPKKMRFMDAGLVVVPEYTEACVLAACGKDAGGADGGGRVVGGGGLRGAAAREQAEVMPRLTEYMRRLLEESGADVRPFIERNPFQPKAPPDTKDDNTSTPSYSAAVSAAHGDRSPTTSTDAGPHTENGRSPSRVLEAAAGTPSSPPAEVVGQALPLAGTTLPGGGGGGGEGGGGGGDASGLGEATGTTPVVAASVPAATAAIAAATAASNAAAIATASSTAEATAPNTSAAAPAAAAGTIRHGDARVSLLDAIEVVLTTGPLSHQRKRGVGMEAEAGAGAAEETGGTGAVAAARRAGLGFQGFGGNVEVSVATAVSELLKVASAAAERWSLPPGEQETLRAWSNAAATSAARYS